MEARFARAAFFAAIMLSLGAGYRTQNFIVNAPSQDVAVQVGKLAEQYRHELAVEWLGKPIGAWREPCPITVQVGPQLGAGGATSFVFDRGRVFGWQMTIQGPLDRLLDSVLPHEVTHTIFASHFRQPLPRWADEGACSTVEHRSERVKQQKMLVRFLQTRRGIAFDDMFRMKEYPRDILPLYAQGHSLATFLIAQGGKQKFVQFVGEGLQTSHWRRALSNHYRFPNLGTLQNTWLEWVKKGSPLPLKRQDDEPLVSNSRTRLLGEAVRSSAGDSKLIRQASDDSGLAGRLVPVHRPDKRPAGDQLAGIEGSRYPADAERSSPGWHRRGEASAPESSDSLDGESRSYESSAPVTSQVTRPQPPQAVKQTIVEWSQPPRAAHQAPAAAPVSTPVPGATSVYEGRGSEIRRR